MLRSLLTLLLAIITLQLNAATPKDTIVTKAYLESLEARMQKLETTTEPGQLTKERLDLINDKIENLQGETERSTANIANQIGESSKTLTIWSIMFAIGGIILTAIINHLQSKAGKYLEESKIILGKSEKILENQRNISIEVTRSEEAMLKVQERVNDVKSEVDKTQNLINHNLRGLYLKLMEEETSELLRQLYFYPGKINQYYNRLVSLRFNDKHFRAIFNTFDRYKDKPEQSDFLTSLFNLLLLHFPVKWFEENELKQYFLEMNHYSKILATYQPSHLQKLIDNICLYWKRVEPGELDYKIGSAYLAMAYKSGEEVRKRSPFPELRPFDPDVQLCQYFYNQLDKNMRFKLYEALSPSYNTPMFWKLLYTDYGSDPDNTTEQTGLLEICKEEYTKVLDPRS